MRNEGEATLPNIMKNIIRNTPISTFNFQLFILHYFPAKNKSKLYIKHYIYT